MLRGIFVVRTIISHCCTDICAKSLDTPCAHVERATHDVYFFHRENLSPVHEKQGQKQSCNIFYRVLRMSVIVGIYQYQWPQSSL